MKLPQLSLTTKIANYFLLLALMTVGIVGGVAYFRAKAALKQAAFDRLNVAATLKEAEITRWFEDQQRDFLQTTQMPDVQKNLAILLNSSVTQEKRQAYQVLTQYLTSVRQIKPSLHDIFILDSSNKIVLSTNQEQEGNYQILANTTYVEQVKVGANFAPIFYICPVTRKPVITLAKPLADRSGMILVDLDLDHIDRIVREKTGLGKSGESYLVGSLVSKNSFIAGKFKFRQNYEAISSPGINAAMSGYSGYGLYRNYADEAVLGVYRWLNKQDIALLVEIHQDEAFDPARKLASAIVFVGLISVFGLLLGVTWLSRQLSFSRQQLEQSSLQLKLKAQEAETANQAKSLFLANMSHELRTPLNAILGFSQLMVRDATVSPENKTSLGIINRSGEHLLNLINDVLEMSKIEAGKITLNNAPLDLHQLLSTIQEMFQVKAEAKGLWFHFILADDLPQCIVSDDRKLRQLLINLLSNAIKFTETGGVTLRAFIDQSNQVSDHLVKLCFAIVDTGKGIAPEELDQLFSPFVQTEAGVKSEAGTGLGLSISRQFVELMGGTIQATSSFGKGSTFAFDLQIEIADSSQIEILPYSQEIKQLAPGQPTYRILIVDDRQTNRWALMKLLQSVGFEPRTANNGVDAIALWQDWQPDLIWMDIRMPVMDGYEATKTIKSHPQGKETVIIALTASAFEEQREKMFQAGCDDFVAKPFSTQIIFAKLTQHLRVKFIYESEVMTQTTKSVKEKKPLSSKDLKFLAPELVSKIHYAAIAVDAEQIEKLVTQIPPSQEYIVQEIKKMLKQYDFDAIIDLTEL